MATGYTWEFSVSPSSINSISITKNDSTITVNKGSGRSEDKFYTEAFVEGSTVTISASGYRNVTTTVGTGNIVMTEAITVIDVLTDNDGKVITLNNQPLCFALPDIYHKVDYIASTGTQYIDTSIIPTSDDLIYEWEGRDDNTSGNTSLFSCEYAVGGDYNNRDFGGVLHGTRSNRNVYLGKTTGMNIKYSSTDGEFHKWSLNINSSHKVYLIKDGTKLTEYSWTGSINRYNSIALFCNHTTSSFSQNASVAYKYFKIRDNNKLVFRGIPVRRKSDQALGMYDLISDTFFGNGGMNTFITDDNNLLFDSSNANIVERCTYNVIDGGYGVVVSATSTYGRASFVFLNTVQNGKKYKIEFDATAVDGYKMVYFHNAAFNPGDGWDTVYGTMSVAAGGHFSKTITSSSNVLWIGIYASATTNTGVITMKNITVTEVTA